MSQETPAPAAEGAAAPVAAPTGRLSSADVVAHLDALEKGDDAKPADETSDDKGEADGADEQDGGDADEPEVEAEDADEPPDSDLDKRVSSIQKQEKRSRDQAELTRLELLRDLDSKKAAFEAEWRPRVEQAQKVINVFERAKEDPSILADELDLDADTMIRMGERFWALGHDKKGDPKFKQVAENMRRDSESRRESSGLKRELQEMKQKHEALERKLTADAIAARAATVISDKHPVLKTLKPEYVQSRIRMATEYLHQKTGTAPDPADVVAKLEQIERADLLERVGPEKFASLGLGAKSADPNTKQKTKPADKKETAPTMKPPQKYSPPNRRRSAEEILAEMDAEANSA